MHKLDHLLWEEWNLDIAEQRFEQLTGIKPSYGGKHPEMGTENSLLSLGEASYLEIIAPDKSNPNMMHIPEEPPKEFYPHLISFGMLTEDLDATRQLINKAGLSTSEVLNVSRQTTDGQLLEWQSLSVTDHGFANLIPFFFMPVSDLPHPARSFEQGCQLRELFVGSVNAEQLVKIYHVLQVDVPIVQSDQSQITAIIKTPKGLLTLSTTEEILVSGE